MLSGDSKKNRIFYFDNLKVLLIVLVVFGHIINSIFPLDSRGTVTNVLWNIIYIFHMPLFIIISGYFSKKYDKYSDNTQKILIGLFLPYIIFNFLFYLFHRNLTIPILPDSAMTIYLLHYLPIMQKVYRKFIPQANEFLALVLCFVFSIVITFVFSRKCFVNIFNKFFDSIAKIIVNQK